jgi:hypothetical protein
MRFVIAEARLRPRRTRNDIRSRDPNRCRGASVSPRTAPRNVAARGASGLDRRAAEDRVADETGRRRERHDGGHAACCLVDAL